MHEDESLRLVERWRGGDEDAAAQLFDRYMVRLVALVRRRLPGKVAARIDADDVVQSACRSFFVHARDGRYELTKHGDLWRLLAAIALNKLKYQLRHHSAEKRDCAAEVNEGNDLFGIPVQALTRDPSPQATAAVTDLLESLLAGLEPVHRRMIEMRLHGYLVEEIAADTSRHERTVRRILDRFAQHLAQPR